MKLTLYRIFSFLLIPMAIIFAIMVIFLIGTSFSNPSMLFPLFMIACIAIYSFAALRFLIKGIDGKKYLSRRFKDWLKVNAYVSIVFAVLMISECVIFILHPSIMQQLVNEQMKTAKMPAPISNEDIFRYLQVITYFFLAYAIVLFVRVLMSLHYTKLYNYLFQNEEK